MPRFTIIDAPSALGLTAKGVEQLPEALKTAGLQAGLDAEYAGVVTPPPYNPERDPETLLLNPEGLRVYTRQLAEAVTAALKHGRFPVVLGGDCSNLIGCALALRRLGRFGLVFIDGHADFYQPEAEPNGEVASMDLAIVSGRGPGVLADIDGLRPLVHDDGIVLFGYRDAEQQREYGSQDVRAASIHAFELERVRSMGAGVAADKTVEILRQSGYEKFWIHLDADVLDDAIMPAVDYRLAGGLGWDELSAVLHILTASGGAVGINIGIFNPRLDADGSIARRFAACLIKGLST